MSKVLFVTKPPVQMGAGSFTGVKRPGRGVNHPPPSRAEFTSTPLLCFRGRSYGELNLLVFLSGLQ
jgi:hypothetical protein